MTKLILRLLVAGAIVAGIVVGVILIFFQTPKLEAAYNNLHSEISKDGEIHDLENYLYDDSIKASIEQSFNETKDLDIFQWELRTLKDNYSKLYSVKNNESKLSEQLTNNVNNYLSKVKELNKALSSIKALANSDINVLDNMIDNSKILFVQQTKLLCKLNKSLIDVLIDTYYENVYDLSIALNKTSTVLINYYYNSTSLEDSEKTALLTKYTAILNLTNTDMELMLDATLSFNSEYTASTTYFIYNLNKIDLNKLLTIPDYKDTLSDEDKIIANNIQSYINNLEDLINDVDNYKNTLNQ